MKSSIIVKVVNRIRENSRGQYGFVKQDPNTGRYLVIEDIAARTTVGQGFRDLNPESKNRPINQFKRAKRAHTLGQNQKNEKLSVAANVRCSNGDHKILEKLLALLPVPELHDDDPFEPVPLLDGRGLTGSLGHISLSQAMTYNRIF